MKRKRRVTAPVMMNTVISTQELKRQFPSAPVVDTEPYLLSHAKWFLHFEQPVHNRSLHEETAKEAIISAITSPAICCLIVAVIGSNVTTLTAYYPGVEQLKCSSIKGAILAHEMNLPFTAPFAVGGHHFKKITSELNFVPNVDVGILVVHQRKIVSYGDVDKFAWRNILFHL